MIVTRVTGSWQRWPMTRSVTTLSSTCARSCITCLCLSDTCLCLLDTCLITWPPDQYSPRRQARGFRDQAIGWEEQPQECDDYDSDWWWLKKDLTLDLDFWLCKELKESQITIFALIALSLWPNLVGLTEPLVLLNLWLYMGLPCIFFVFH